MAFDEETAQVRGIPVRLVSLLFSTMTGMIVAAAMPIVGVLLVSSLIVLPAALAIRVAPSFNAAVGLAMLVGVGGVFTGLSASYELSTPPGGTIALTLLVILGAGIALKKAAIKISVLRGKSRRISRNEKLV
ncbi:metal ABC transporter permease [Cohnella sp. LGH]